MLKNNKGITMVALVIMIIVMLIISGVIIYTGTGAVNNAKKQSILTNMLLIQAKARTIQDKHEFEDAEYIGVLMNETKKNELGIQVESNVYILSTQAEIDEMDVDVSGANKYAVDYENDEVYYIEGIEDKKTSTKYYSLTDISNMDVEENQESE